MAQLRSDLLIRLTDRASGPARGILGLMNRLRTVGAGAGGGMAAMGDRATRSIGVLHVKLLAATAAAYGLHRAMAGMVTPAASFETKMLDIAQKADLSNSGMAALGDRIRKMATEMGRGAGELAQGVDTLLGFGLDTDKTMAAMPAIARTATAYGARIEDLSQAVYFAINNLKLPAQEAAQALETMGSAGKDGGFELKDMAAEFPALTAAAQALGMTGVDAIAKLSAALQIARNGASSGAEAATNTANLLQKIQSQDAVNKWKKFGVDIREEVIKTQKAGGDMFEMVAEKAAEVLKGDLGKLGDLYQDAEVQKFLRPLIQNLDKYREIRDRAFRARGGIQRDYENRLRTFDGQVRRLSAAFEELRIRAGNRLLGPLTRFVSALGDRLVNIDKSVNIFDRLGASIRGLATGILGPGSDGGIAQAFGKLGDLIFGNADTLSEDVDKLGQSFERFRQMGAALREFAEAIGGFVSRFNELTGLDFGALAGWAATLGAAALGVTLFAKAVRGLASAIALLTGMKALWSIGKSVASLLPGSKPTVPAAKPAQPAQPAPAAKPRYSFNNSTGQWEPKGAAARGGVSALAGRLRGGIAGLVADMLGKTALETLFDAVDKGLKLDTSYRPDPGFGPTLRRLMGSGSGVNLDQGTYERSRRIDDEFRRDPEAARGRAMMRQSAGEGEQRVRLATSDLAALLQPKGTQDVRVTNPPPAPVIHNSVSVTVSTNAPASEIGAAVAKQVGAATKRSLEGAFSDAAN